MNTLTGQLAEILVIGYGNTLRGDDGVGYQVAETVATWDFPQLRSQAVHQLLPELAVAIATVEIVFFVDAVVTQASASPTITVVSLSSAGHESLKSHYLTPQSLLSLTERLYGKTPTAYLLTIPAHDFTLGTTLSPLTVFGKDLALDYLRNFILANLINPNQVGI